MVRPRLVEEGKPLTEQEEWEPNHSTAVHNNQSLQQVNFDGQSSPQPPVTASVPTRRSSGSSLMQATGGRVPQVSQQRYHRRPRRNMSIVIGQENAMELDESSDGDCDGDRDNRATPSAINHQHHNSSSHHYRHTNDHNISRSATYRSSSGPLQSHIEIGADYRRVERMEGVEDHSVKAPMIVLDGANVAYAYAQMLLGIDNSASRPKFDPDVRGIRVAGDYFAQAGLRVNAVLPSGWYRFKNRSLQDRSSDETAWLQKDQQDTILELQRRGWLVGAPPTDDDDAYVLTIAQRENARAWQHRQGQGPAFCLSNDLFRDAQARDPTGQLGRWLNEGTAVEHGPGRLSFAFCDMGQLDEYGQRQLDIVPNPRHPLTIWVEQQQRQQTDIPR